MFFELFTLLFKIILVIGMAGVLLIVTVVFCMLVDGTKGNGKKFQARNMQAIKVAALTVAACIVTEAAIIAGMYVWLLSTFEPL